MYIMYYPILENSPPDKKIPADFIHHRDLYIYLKQPKMAVEFVIIGLTALSVNWFVCCQLSYV